MARQTKERAEQTRMAIIDAGIDVFFREGMARASLEEVARASHVTRGAVYWHFRGKNELFMALEDRLREPQRAELAALLAIQPSKDALAALQATIMRTLTEIATDESISRLMTVVLLRIDCSREAAPALHRQAEHQAHFRDGLQRYFREIVPAPGRASGWTQASAADALFAMVQGAILRGLRFPDEYPLGTVGIPIVKTFMDALRKTWLQGRPDR